MVERASIAAVAALLLLVSVSGASAQEAFYKGKTVHLVLSTGVGGGYALYGRLLARHLPDHLAGKPNIVVENMPGAGGVKAANWLYGQAPRNGTTLGMVQLGVPLAPLMGNKGATYDPTKFNWLGSMDREAGTCLAWYLSPIRTFADMRETEFVVGGTGVGSVMLMYPALLNMFAGTKIKVVAGYADGSSVYLAMERGEVMGVCGPFLTTIKATLPGWITGRKFNVPIAVYPRRLKDFPDTPAITEFVTDEFTRQVFEPSFAIADMQRPLFAPPGVPQERVRELREAFLATMTDPAFRAEAERARLSIDHVGGEELAETIRRSYALPPAAIEAARKAMGNAF
jgi:tripartite-type tricarboxylate transporter receptor subunit TctC